MFNHVGLLGRLAQEPEIRYTQAGTPVASFDLAVAVPSKDRNAPPDYIPIVAWANQAEFCGKYLSKGRQIVVEGRISTRKYDGNDGKKHKVVEVNASRIYFADSNNGNTDTGNNTPATGSSDEFMQIPEGEELPFN